MTTQPWREIAQQAPSRLRNRMVAAAAVLLIAVAGGGVYLGLGNTDEAQIRRVVTDFATSVERQDYPVLLDLLCTEEATGITEDDDYDPAAQPVDAAVPEFDVTDVRITPDGQSATALITTPGREPGTLSLRRERDRWTVCAPN
ncbi:hypothetical protein K1T35_11690 [Pseudonocardia sp. DSM 110487]|uniref:Rv0361 family membrane protein n=1 Tax=Pseudonocardia sp. DSM 110487 TaxID=2865833 RepID=UPI001C6961DC|nr:hypothetical protein [Pseudonocardia sp. DSM 110487]QYN37840.1 hypothetical protein K1T35_11690 [Pseudonocardia sp. DSM 110487]